MRSFVSLLGHSVVFGKARRRITLGLVVFTYLAVAANSIGLTAVRKPGTAESVPLARLSQAVTIKAAGGGNPWISLADGHDVIAQYAGPQNLVEALRTNQAEPLTLASADFDEDGVPDLVCGYRAPDGTGIVTLYRGNVDSIYPNSPEANRRRAEGTFTDSPFLSPAVVFQLPEPPDFIAAGDFNADGHWDLVAASRNDHALYLMRGDGHGHLLEAERSMELPGNVTAMAVGYVNRRDGLDDIVAGVSGSAGPKLMVFEGPEGALRSTPEVFELPDKASSIALGQLDDQYPIDIAVAAGHELVVVHGRDRKLSLDKSVQAKVPSAVISRRRFAFQIRSVAAGGLSGRYHNPLALLCGDGALRLARCRTPQKGTTGPSPGSDFNLRVMCRGNWSRSARIIQGRAESFPVDGLVVVDPAAKTLQVLADTGRDRSLEAQGHSGRRVSLQTDGTAADVLPMRLNGDAPNDLVVLRDGHSNVSVLLSTPQSTLTVTNTNDSGPGSLRDAINLANETGPATIGFNIPGSGLQTITLMSLLPVCVNPVTIDGFTQAGSSPNTLPSGSDAVCEIELTGPDFQIDAFQDRQGVLAITGGSSVIRGLVINGIADAGVVISGSGGNIVEGTIIGLDSTGTIPKSSNVGIVVQSSSNMLGGVSPAARNIISGNPAGGVQIFNETTELSDIQIQGNFIGTDPTGSHPLGNSTNVDLGGLGGIEVDGGSNLTIGGTAAGARNLISSNGVSAMGIGRSFQGVASQGILIQGNFIGTDATGSMILLNPDSQLIGSNPAGIDLSATDCTIGGTAPSARNLISGNIFGVFADGSPGLLVQGNLVGTDITGRRMLGNAWYGVAVLTSPTAVVGGAVVEARNIISGNGLVTEPGYIPLGGGVSLGDGVLFSSEGGPIGGTGTVVQGNYIGTDISGSLALGNRSGIYVENESLNEQIKENVIAFNTESGVRIPDDPSFPNEPHQPAIQISVQSNSIHSNGVVAIDLGPVGVTANPHNLQTGANLHQNFPDLTSATVNAAGRSGSGRAPSATATINISGTLSASPSVTYSLEFFLGGSCSAGLGHQFIGFLPELLGSGSVITDVNGNANYSFSFPVPMGNSILSGYVNATATDPQGNTSEFSLCASVVGTIPIPPTITSVSASGKNLVITGQNFDSGAVILESGAPQKTVPDSQNPTTSLIGKKLYKRLAPGATVTIQVRNSDGSVSNQVTYTKPSE